MEPPFPVKDKELRLDPIEFVILLKLRDQEYELKQLTESIKKEFGGMLEITEEDIFKRLENLRVNGFVSLEKRGVIGKKNYFKLTDAGEKKLKEDIKLFQQEIVIFNKIYSTILKLVSASFPKTVEDISKALQNSIMSFSDVIKTATEPLQDAFFGTLNQILKAGRREEEKENQT